MWNKDRKSDYRRKLFHGGCKTEHCLIIEKYLDIVIHESLHTDTVCRKCTRDLHKIDSSVLKLKLAYQSTIDTLKETHGQEKSSKRLINDENEQPSTGTSRKSLFKQTFEETEVLAEEHSDIDCSDKLKVFICIENLDTSGLFKL